MTTKVILTGDVNLMRVTDPAVPFRHVASELHAADVVFSNLECCLRLQEQSHANEGFFADPKIGGEALTLSGIHAVGIANNVNYGWANISASIGRLDEIGVLHTGAGANLAAAHAPAIVERNGLCVGALQRSSVYWPTDHEAQVDSPGIAVMKGHTAYHVPIGRISPDIPPANRPGIPPVILTWADATYLEDLRNEIAALRPRVDVLIGSFHWGLGREPLQYMKDIAHAAIDAGADVVMGHGPHHTLPIEIYKGRPIFYGLGNLTFNTGHLGRKHAGWIGMLVDLTIDNGVVGDCHLRFVRANEKNESYFPSIADEAEFLTDLIARSSKFGTGLTQEADRIRVTAGR
ncbi:MAG TPA: CapA family protein [Pseudolabrys sp.]|jgi:poly-gamma-glutamate synthesis protein (capsule biosynthesis protein)